MLPSLSRSIWLGSKARLFSVRNWGQIRRLGVATTLQRKYPHHPYNFAVLLLGAVGATTCFRHYSTTLCEEPQPAEGQALEIDEEMVNDYVQSLMKDHEMAILPFGLGKSAPFVFDIFDLHKELVKEAIRCFEGTIDYWNHPQAQSVLAGHPIVYTRTRNYSVRRIVHNPNLAVPFEVLELIADTLLEEPKVTASHAWLMRWLPRDFKRLVTINLLHILTSILVDLMLGSSVSVHQGAFQMTWTFHPDKAQAYYQSLHDPATIKDLIQKALEQMDFEAIEELAAETLASSGEQNSFLFSVVGHDIYSTAYKVMLIVFYVFNWDTECRMLGRSVRQRCVKPLKKKEKMSSSTVSSPDAAQSAS